MTSRIEYNNPHGSGQLGLAYHYEMLSDRERIEPFHKAIEKVCKGKIVFESGTGSSVLSTLAARAGAKKVYAAELDPAIAAFARINIAASGLTNKIKLIEKSTLDITIDDLEGNHPEVVIAENLSTWQVTEPEIQVMNHITSKLASPNAIRLPTLVNNYIELTNSSYVFYDTIVVRAHYFQFTGIKSPALLSAPSLYSQFDLREVNPENYHHSIEIVATNTGLANSLRLTSPLVLIDNITFSSSDSLMPPVVVPLEQDVYVNKGDRLRVHINYSTNTSWEQFKARIEAIK